MGGCWDNFTRSRDIWTSKLGQTGNIATALSTCGASCCPYKEVQLPGASMIHQIQQNRSNRFDWWFWESDWLLTWPLYFLKYSTHSHHKPVYVYSLAFLRARPPSGSSLTWSRQTGSSLVNERTSKTWSTWFESPLEAEKPSIVQLVGEWLCPSPRYTLSEC